MSPPAAVKPQASAQIASAAPRAASAPETALPILFAISGAHLLNDTIQSLLPALYPILKKELAPMSSAKSSA